MFSVLDYGIKFSVRSDYAEVRADELAAYISEHIGSGGGHIPTYPVFIGGVYGGPGMMVRQHGGRPGSGFGAKTQPQGDGALVKKSVSNRPNKNNFKIMSSFKVKTGNNFRVKTMSNMVKKKIIFKMINFKIKI